MVDDIAWSQKDEDTVLILQVLTMKAVVDDNK